MYNLYNGSGKWVRQMDDGGISAPSKSAELPRPAVQDRGFRHLLPGEISGLYESLQKKILGELETEDMIILLILYLMYRESGDTELLIVMGGMLLL